MAITLEQLLDINPEGEPVITGTKITVKQILEKLAAGVRANEIVTVCHLPNDRVMDLAVEYAESLPSKCHLAPSPI